MNVLYTAWTLSALEVGRVERTSSVESAISISGRARLLSAQAGGKHLDKGISRMHGSDGQTFVL